jgi:FtsH-binding integral membrane protein
MPTIVTALSAPHPARLGSRPVWLVSALAGVTAALATELYALAARAVGVPMRAGTVGADTSGPIAFGAFAMGTLSSAFWGTVLAVLLTRYARRPARTYAITTVALTVLSLVAPLAAGDTAASTKAMLALSHLIAAAVIIPVVTRRLTRAPGRRR